MKPTLRKIIIFLLLGCVALLIQWADPSGRYFNLPGLLWVFIGPVVMTALAHSTKGIVALLKSLPEQLRNEAPIPPQELQLYLHIVELHRLGNTRGAEQAGKRLQDSLWRQGVELVIQRTATADLTRILQWRIAAIKERYNEDLKMIRTLGTFAPAFGMLATLTGLIEMMYALDANNLDKIGTAMGFSMLATAYGLALANLVFKPIASRLERRSKAHLTKLQAQIETIRMLNERSHANLIREYWQAFQSHPQEAYGTTVVAPAATAATAATAEPVLRLVKASG